MWLVIVVSAALLIVLLAAAKGPQQPQARSPWLVTSVVMLLAASVAVAVGSSTGMWSLPHGGMMLGGDRGGSPPSTVPGVTQIAVIVDDMFFEPNRIEISSGEPVTVSVENRGRIFHDFSIIDVDFRIPVDARSQASGTLPSLVMGEYRFECTVPGHAQAGMVGVLVVATA